jgi:acetolactate synthase-1/2/3 large subunit
VSAAERTAAQLLVDCLAVEGCEYVFSVPGEETMDILDALGAAAGRDDRRSAPRHITTRHEQGAAFMADVHGRLTGRRAVAMATLGPGATNLDHRDRRRLPRPRADGRDHRPGELGQAPQGGPPGRRHRRMIEPVTKWNTRVERVEAIPEIVRKAFRVATLEKPGPDPHRAAGEPRGDGRSTTASPARPGRTYFPEPTDEAIAHAAELIATSRAAARPRRQRRPARRRAPELRAFARGLHVPVAVTFMGKGAIDDRSHLSLMAVGLQARDHVLSGFDRADS